MPFFKSKTKSKTEPKQKKKVIKLTAKQEKFCQLVSTGTNISDAYRKAYNTKAMKPTTINKKASELFAVGHITARIELLKERIVAKRTWSRAESIQVLSEIAKNDERSTPKVAAVKELNSMHGYHAPTKIAPTDPTGEFQYDPVAAREKLLEMIQKKKKEEK